MKIRKLIEHYSLIYMTEDDLRSLLRLINSDCLPERRDWNNIKQQIEKELTK